VKMVWGLFGGLWAWLTLSPAARRRWKHVSEYHLDRLIMALESGEALGQFRPGKLTRSNARKTKTSAARKRKFR